jgi:hypothetical protein
VASPAAQNKSIDRIDCAVAQSWQRPGNSKCKRTGLIHHRSLGRWDGVCLNLTMLRHYIIAMYPELHASRKSNEGFTHLQFEK